MFANALNSALHAPKLFSSRVRQLRLCRFFTDVSKPSVPLFSNLKGIAMNRLMLISALLATLSLGACDRPAVVNVPATPVAVPGPAGPTGATGSQGNDGSTGATGKSGDGTTVIVMPPASAPAN